MKAGEVSLEGGWRVYSSGGGIAVRLVHECFLGIRKGKAALVIDPVMPKELDGLGAEVELAGKRANILYRVSNLGYGPTALTFNGSPLPFLRGENPYRLRVHIIAKTGPRPVLPKHGNARPGRCVAPPPMGRRAP